MRPSTCLSRLYKRLALCLLLPVILFAAATSAGAQTTLTELQSMTVELWPDYDRPSMLVLMTGAVPAGTTLPVELSLPVPAGAEIHAVASFNEAGALMTNTAYTVDNDRLTLTTPSERFRVEYYSPYEVVDGNYLYTFEWLSDMAVGQMNVAVQQPLAAVDFTVNPTPAASSAERGDDLTYHTLPSRSVAAGELFTVEVRYTVDAPVLSVSAQTPISQAPPADAGDGIDPLWFLIGAGVLALAGGAFYLGRYQGRAGSRARKPQPARPARPTNAPAAKKPPASPAIPSATARFCHNCGNRAAPEDSFCRNCGTALKTDK